MSYFSNARNKSEKTESKNRMWQNYNGMLFPLLGNNEGIEVQQLREDNMCTVATPKISVSVFKI